LIVTDDGISQEVKALIAERIDSVVQLEVLLLLHGAPQKEWTAAAVAQELRIEGSWAEDQLNELTNRGLLAQVGHTPPAYRYSPRTADLATAVDGLKEAYADRRVTVISLIFSKPVDKLRSFADAFRLRRDKTDG
jgi:hypothetical protein